MSPGKVLAQGDERCSEHVRKAGAVHGDVAGSNPVDCLAVSVVFRGSLNRSTSTFPILILPNKCVYGLVLTRVVAHRSQADRERRRGQSAQYRASD